MTYLGMCYILYHRNITATSDDIMRCIVLYVLQVMIWWGVLCCIYYQWRYNEMYCIVCITSDDMMTWHEDTITVPAPPPHSSCPSEATGPPSPRLVLSAEVRGNAPSPHLSPKSSKSTVYIIAPAKLLSFTYSTWWYECNKSNNDKHKELAYLLTCMIHLFAGFELWHKQPRRFRFNSDTGADNVNISQFSINKTMAFANLHYSKAIIYRWELYKGVWAQSTL